MDNDLNAQVAALQFEKLVLKRELIRARMAFLEQGIAFAVEILPDLKQQLTQLEAEIKSKEKA